SRLRSEDLEQRVEQARQEREALSVRLQQQKKFYDDEREQRRKRELEILQHKKEIQELTASLRQMEQQSKQRTKLQEDESQRWKQKEQMLTRRVEQLQREFRGASARLEQSKREADVQRHNFRSEQERTDRARNQVARRTLISEQIEETEKLVKGEVEPDSEAEVSHDVSDADEPPRVLENLEAQAQDEIEEWQRRAEDAEEDDETVGPVDSESSEEPYKKSLFRPRPWMKRLK
ncbi:MAG: hypothetical protein QF886_18795, partial [Planctomycetota bacterium]|nr:hypothetical protein [Planctomycetota bacterium]